jgi:nucleotide-binding universal stress UspA family protein
MYKKILVPLDGSKTAETVLLQVRELAKLMNAEIVLMIVAVDSSWEPLFTGPKLAAAMSGSAGVADKAASYLLTVAAWLGESGLKVGVHVANGLVVESILSFAEDIRADLIVMSSGGKSQLMEQPLGSTAYQVARRSRTEVLLVRQPVTAASGIQTNPTRELRLAA